MNIPFINAPKISAKSLTELLNAHQCINHPIAICNWSKDYPYQPLVHVRVAHNSDSILLEYHVKEKYIRAKYDQPNQSVWTDSCVEFFFSPDSNESYYNLEMNCIGTPLLNFRKNTTTTPQETPNEILENIDIFSTLGNLPFTEKIGDFEWTLTAVIPITLFTQHPSLQLSELTAKGNFYKCGDELSEPHFLSWTIIDNPVPKFHLPHFFGQLHFSK